MRQPRNIWSVILAAGLFALAGCSQDLVLSADYEAPAATASEPQLNSAWAVIGPDGGSVSISGARVSLPPGALSSSLVITISRRTDGSVDLGPEGTQFLVPVTLELGTPNPAGAVVRWFDPSTGTWVVIPSSASQGCRRAPLVHFSLYQVIEAADLD